MSHGLPRRIRHAVRLATALAVVALAVAAPASADAPGLPPMPKSLEEMGGQRRPAATPPSMEGFGAANPGCLEWSDSCQVCRVEDGGKPACSTVAIACRRTAPACVKSKP